MNIEIKPSDLLLTLPDDDAIASVITKAITKLSKWVHTESLKRGKTALKIKNPKRLITRFLKFKRTKTKGVKLWLGANALGVDAFGTPVQSESGVTVNGTTYKSAFINSMGSSEPLVWRRNADNKLERVTKNIDQPVQQVAAEIAAEIQQKFDELIEGELNAIL